MKLNTIKVSVLCVVIFLGILGYNLHGISGLFGSIAIVLISLYFMYLTRRPLGQIFKWMMRNLLDYHVKPYR